MILDGHNFEEIDATAVNENEYESIYKELKRADFSIEKKVKFCLYLNGWSGEKKPSKVIEDMRTYGLHIFYAGRLFFEQFEGMSIRGMAFPPWFPKETPDTVGYKYYVNIPREVDIEDISFLEALQIRKNELLLPIATEDRLWVAPTIYLSETGKVYYSYEGKIGDEATDMFSYFAQVFGFKERDYESRHEEVFADYILLDEIEEQLHQNTYIPYAQRRFPPNGSIPNTIHTNDMFTQWLLTMK